MPNAKGRFLGMSVPSKAKWPPERRVHHGAGAWGPHDPMQPPADDKRPECDEPEHEHDPHGVCKRAARFPINEPPYCSCVGGACRKGA